MALHGKAVGMDIANSYSQMYNEQASGEHTPLLLLVLLLGCNVKLGPARPNLHAATLCMLLPSWSLGAQT